MYIIQYIQTRVYCIHIHQFSGPGPATLAPPRPPCQVAVALSSMRSKRFEMTSKRFEEPSPIKEITEITSKRFEEPSPCTPAVGTALQAPDLMLWKPIFQRRFFPGGVSDTGGTAPCENFCNI